LLGRQNQAFDAVASVRLLARVERVGSFDVASEVSSGPSSTETVPDNNRAVRTVDASAYAGSRPRGRVLLKLVSAKPRLVVVRVTGLGPDDARAVVVNKERVGTLAPGAERTITFRFKKPQRSFTIEQRSASSSATSIDVGF
jgi:hypothetical protein